MAGRENRRARERPLQGEAEISLQGHHLLVVVAQAEMDLRVARGLSPETTTPVLQTVRRDSGMKGLTENGLIVGGNTDFPLQSQQVVPTAHGRILTAMDETVDGVGIETGCRETGGINTDQDVGLGDILVVFVHGLIIDDLHQDAERGVQAFSGPQGVLQGNANDHIGTHGPRQVNGIVVGEETVDQHHIPFADRGKDGGNGH